MQCHFTNRFLTMLRQIITTVLQAQLMMIKIAEYNRIDELFRLKFGCPL